MEAKNIRIGNVTSDGIVKTFWECEMIHLLSDDLDSDVECCPECYSEDINYF